MKKRLITAAIGILFLILVVFVAPGWCFGIAVGIISAVAAFELLRCVVPDSPRKIRYSAIGIAFFLPVSFSLGFPLRWSIWVILLVFFVFSCELMISFHMGGRVTFEMVAVSMLAGVVMPMMLGTLARMERENGAAGHAVMLLPFVVAFTCDSGAYFVGHAMGKHKMAPRISPNKTVEGAVGGILCSLACCVVYGLILRGLGMTVRLWSLAIYGVLGGFISQLGDLTFSAIKRQYGIKDYGNFFPGHGGALDRFDSMYYLAPLTEFWMLVLPAIYL